MHTRANIPKKKKRNGTSSPVFIVLLNFLFYHEFRDKQRESRSGQEGKKPENQEREIMIGAQNIVMFGLATHIEL
jgi:hypothetical protein